MYEPLKAPFPWFGGKSRAAEQVSAAFGDVQNYVEPFAGSLGVLLQRQPTAVETVNDADAHLVNVWRSIAWHHTEVAKWADWPVSEADLSARHLWLVQRTAEIRECVQADPEWCDPKAAGWWVWGACAWIGSGWCSGDGPWTAQNGRLTKDQGRGIKRKLPHLGDQGRGINRQLPHLGNQGRGINRQDQGIKTYLAALSARLRRVRIACGDWSRVCTPIVTWRHGTTGVLLDPPYLEGWDVDGAYNAQSGDTRQLWSDITDWCAENGRRDDMRIVVCGYDGMWTPPEGWSVRRWTARSGYNRSHDRHKDEVLWCSPACIAEVDTQPRLF